MTDKTKQELREQIGGLVLGTDPDGKEYTVKDHDVFDDVMQLITRATEQAEIQGQLNLIDYLDQTPSNELMDWKGLFADTRKLLKEKLHTQQQSEEGV